MKPLWSFLLALSLAVAPAAAHADDRAVEVEVVDHDDGTRTLAHSAIVDAPPEKVWEAFSTREGWKSWGVAFAEMDVRVGGTIESGYVPGAEAGDPRNIVHRILALVPNRLMVTRVEKAPEGGPVGMDVLGRLWAVYELEELDEGRTRLTISGHGYRDGQPDDGIIAFFEQANTASIEMMRTAIEAQD